MSTDQDDSYVDVRFTPTIPHCSMAALIGLAIHTKLRRFILFFLNNFKRSLPKNMKIIVRITPGSHSTEDSINRQLADKERVWRYYKFKHIKIGVCCYGKCESDANNKFMFKA